MVKSETVTLTAATVATVTLTGDFEGVRVKSDGAAAVSYTVGASTPSDPTVGGADTYYVPDSAAVDYPDSWNSGQRFSSVTVKAISAGTPTVCVEAF